jgi:hypothetical protein
VKYMYVCMYVQLLDWYTDYKKRIFPFSFIHLVDYMMLHLLHMLSRNSLEDLVIAIRTHYCFLPSDTSLLNVETYNKLEYPRPVDAPQVRVNCV